MDNATWFRMSLLERGVMSAVHNLRTPGGELPVQRFEQTEMIGEFTQQYHCSTYNVPCKVLNDGDCDGFP